MKNIVPTISQALLLLIVALLIVWLPFSNSNVLINGIQTAKTFDFIYSVMVLALIGAIGWLFRKLKLQIIATPIDILFIAFIVWVSVNKYLIHDFYSLSLKYYELLGLFVLYCVIRFIDKKYYLLLFVTICLSGTVQAIYGCLQLWGFYPSYHGLFNMTGSFFNPGPYAGFLCGVLPVAVGVYWMNINSKFQVSGLRKNFRLQVSSFKSVLVGEKSELGGNQKLEATTGDFQPETLNLKPLIIKYISVTTIITILLVLPAARSRAAWLGAIAGVAYLAWHKYNFNSLFKSFINGNKKSLFGAKRSPGHREGDLGVKTRKLALVLISALIIFGGTLGLYHFKKDSADGRLLIWAVTANIIKDNPLLGVGQDRFKTHYMDYQADYFRNNPDSMFGMMADDNQYAFNEPLKIWAEEGLVGLLIAAGIVFSIFFTPMKNSKFRYLNSKFQVSSSKLNSEQPESKHSEAEIGAAKPATCNLNRSVAKSTERSVVKPETLNLKPVTIIRAAILSILVFGLFAYPSEILPIKIVAIICLGLLANYFALNTSNTSEAINREASHTSTAKSRCTSGSNDEVIKHEVSNGAAKPETCNLNWSVAKSTERSVVKPVTWNLKPVISLAIILIIIFAYPKINTLKNAYVTWKDAMDLYYSGLYEESLEDYENAYSVLKYNGEYLVNYGKALSIAEKHTEAITILEQAKSYQSNSVLYNALGDSYKALEKYDDAEQPYWQAANMSPAKFYPLYLLAKLYDASGQQQKALEMANTILNKEVKVHSTAIEEIKEEMQQIIEQ